MTKLNNVMILLAIILGASAGTLLILTGHDVLALFNWFFVGINASILYKRLNQQTGEELNG